MTPKNVQMPNPNPKYKPPGTPAGGRGGNEMKAILLDEAKKWLEENCENLYTRMAVFGLMQSMPTVDYQEEPNEPLTLEELREMSGHPVWVKQLKGLSVCDTDWAVVEFRLEPDVKHDKIRVWWPGSEDEDTPSEDDYGKTWIAYRRPPEGEGEEKHVIEITENL